MQSDSPAKAILVRVSDIRKRTGHNNSSRSDYELTVVVVDLRPKRKGLLCTDVVH